MVQELIVQDAVVNALTFDVEDWYMGLEIGMERWSGFEKRLDRGLDVALDVMARAGTKGTFFVVGKCAEEHPRSIRRIADAGHELGTHGYSHTKVYEMTPDAFDADLARSIQAIGDATGQRVRGFRAPYFSITAESRWALDHLAKHGLTFDASIYPGPNYRYGIDGSPEQPYLAGTPPIAEFPTSLGRVARLKFGLGGGYFRILPYQVTRYCIQRMNARKQSAMFYLHPWEFDPDQPRIRMPRRRAQLTHYFRLGATRRRFERLLSDFRFSTVSDVLTRMSLLSPAPQ